MFSLGRTLLRRDCCADGLATSLSNKGKTEFFGCLFLKYDGLKKETILKGFGQKYKVNVLAKVCAATRLPTIPKIHCSGFSSRKI